MKKMLVVSALVAAGCSQGANETSAVPTPAKVPNRAYVVCRDSDDLTVIDLDSLEIVGHGNMKTESAHMAEIPPGGDRILVSSTGTHEIVEVDTRSFEVSRRIPVGKNPTHETMLAKKSLLAIMDEGEGAISFVDVATRREVKRVSGFRLPHFLRADADGKYGYVANLRGNAITRVDLDTLTIDGEIALDGLDPSATLDGENGFADAQIDANGVLYAAHAASGRVLVYDTKAHARLPELSVGARPWIVFADHHFAGLPQTHVVPNFGDRTVSLIAGAPRAVLASVDGDREAYGVNYSPRAPGRAYVMNRVREDIAVVDTEARKVIDRIPVGGNTETASTSADGKYIVAAVSSANRVVVIDVATGHVVKTFEAVGKYPWTVAIYGGQNYCH